MSVMIFRTKMYFLVLVSGLMVVTAGCVTLKSEEEIPGPVQLKVERKGVYHKVKKGETLWRIAKTYHVSIGDIAQSNNIPEVAKIEKNQLVFIPGADAVKDIPLDTDQEQNEFIWPIEGKIIRYFHQRENGRINKGINIRAQDGDVVRAARTGRVVFADFLGGYGYTVVLDHLDGLYSVYAKNSKLLVKLDDLVLKNSDIALVGQSGNAAYLHFQIRKNSIEDNPLYYLP